MSNPPSQLDYQPRKPRTWQDKVSAEWTSIAAKFTRENIIANLKTLAWVVPLTLLIWIYAERAQVNIANDVAVPFELVSVDPNRVVSLNPKQDKNLILQLQGPRARLQEVQAKLRDGLLPQGLKIEVPTGLELNKEIPLDALPLVSNQKVFVDSGVIVRGCQPPRLEVQVDQLVEREARIVRPPGAKNIDATFNPPTVKVKGPLALLNRAEQTPRLDYPGELVVWADVRDNGAPRTFEAKDLLIRRPPELEDERVSILTPTPTGVTATVTVRRSDKTLRIPSMTITSDTPEGLLDKYKIIWERPKQGVIQNVVVSGPPDIIDAMEKDGFEPKPKAHIVLTQQDATAGDVRTKKLKYDLPDKIEVVEEDRDKSVELRLVDKTALPTGP